MSSNSTEPDSDLPRLTTFRGWLRSHRPEANNIWGEAALKLAFPRFDPPVWTEQAIQEAHSRVDANVDAIVLQPAQHRRYGGYDLARGCYFTLCVDASGDDFFTLSTELNAYRDRSDQDIIVDVMDGKHFPAEIFSNPGLSKEIQRLKDACLVVSIFPASRLRAAVEALGKSSLERMSNPEAMSYLTDGNRVHVILLPSIKEYQIDRVVDLRLPETRESFHQIFHTGKAPAEGDDSAFWRPLGNNISAFWEMIPELIDPFLGGTKEAQGGLTQAIGGYLRARGVAGLIYPSARNDSFAEIKAGQLSRYGGWNFVDYRHSPKPWLRHFVCTVPWQNAVMQGVSVQKPEVGEYAGSLAIEGVRRAHQREYEESYGEARQELLAKLEAGPPVVLFLGSFNLDRIDAGIGDLN